MSERSDSIGQRNSTTEHVDVEVSVALTAAHKAVLGVLLDGIELFPCCNFKFRACPLRNLTYEVERAFAGCGRREERDVMPR